MAKPLWRPGEARVREANLTRFRDDLAQAVGVAVPDMAALQRFSVAEPGIFWSFLKDFAGLKAETWGARALVDGDRMPGARWFPDARLNFAENLLARRDEAEAVVFHGEDQMRQRMTFSELYEVVARTARALKAHGVGMGDRVAGILPNMPEAIVAALAAHSLGAVWSSCSPDFGVQGVLDRFGQIEPKVLFVVDGYFYGGKAHDCLEKTAAIAEALPSVTRVVVVPYRDPTPDLGAIRDCELFPEFTAEPVPGDIDFVQLPFDHPLYILYSSGTTGVPKCIVHGTGGTLLKHASEHILHCDIKPDDRLFYFTTCGWMMWNWLVSGLAFGATLLLYDGNPFYPDGNTLFDFADAEAMTFFGTSAKYIDAVHKAGLSPADSHRLDTVRAMASTGSPLAPESFDFVYKHIKRDLHLASIAGGTDIVGCFVLGDPTAPVWRGEIQTAGLGLAVAVFDDDGKPIEDDKGELVCTKPFPSMPVGFWDDRNGARYRAAYFERFPGVWHHGDFVARTEHGGYVIYGRSDATLNPGGVRIGTAEIYRQVEQFDEVLESIVIGQEWDDDTRVVLFVVLRPGLTLGDDLIVSIRTRIRANCSPRHMPAKVIQVADIPRTKSGKITELAVRDTVHGRAVKNKEALANPEALELYRDLAALRG